MYINEREDGYSCDIAFKQLIELYASSSDFKCDWHNLNMRSVLIQYRQKQFQGERRGEPLILGLIKNRDNYTRLTKIWRDDWEVLTKIISDDTKTETIKTAEKWGLRCDWGYGIMLSMSPRLLGLGIFGISRTTK